MNKVIHIHKLCLGHLFFLFSFTVFPSKYTSLLLSQKDISTHPTAPRQNQDKMCFLPPILTQAPGFCSHSSSEALISLQLSYSFHSLTLRRLSFYNSAPGLNFISSYDVLPSPLAQLFSSSRDTLVITHLGFQDIKF